MPFPQFATGLLTTALNAARAISTATATAVASDVIVCSGGAGAYTITLPAVTLGAVVVVINQDSTAAHTVTVVSAEGAGTKVAGAAGDTGVVLPVGGLGVAQVQGVFASDGTNWQMISR